MASAVLSPGLRVCGSSLFPLSRISRVLQPHSQAVCCTMGGNAGLWAGRRAEWRTADARPRWCACRSLLTSGDHEKARSLASWQVKDQPAKIKEAGQGLLEDLKETKAKVREKMGEIVERENIWTVPNLLCVGRIGLSPYLCHLVLAADHHWALGLFLLAGTTDLLDGWIARTFPGQSSNLGSFLDPLADKTLVAMLFLSLTYVDLIPLPLTGLIIYRDVLIIGGASYVRYKSLPPPRTIARYFDATHATARLAPTTLSKFNTAVQLSLITAALAAPIFAFTDHTAFKALCWLTAATTLSSGLSYIFSRDTYKFLRSMDELPK
ncbi:cardiolipin synthase (CMP-forming)-like [Eriocheir sinensis]|uniref:cardiolipin synthase (CMP-forming)-like n=1 Tax=Eriocheir sinensis TaxID=95602 RepID=UPI0021C9B201|nr:cardiolipin synthase (CMP-forming)-like [Eriocheir sinensis]